MSLERREGFVADHKEFGLHIRSEIAGKPAVQFAQKIANVVNETAPFAEKKTGDRRRRHLRGSYKVKSTKVRAGRNTRASAEVYSDLLEASTNEFGTSTQRARRPLLKAAIAKSIEEFGTFDGSGPKGAEL